MKELVSIGRTHWAASGAEEQRHEVALQDLGHKQCSHYNERERALVCNKSAKGTHPWNTALQCTALAMYCTVLYWQCAILAIYCTVLAKYHTVLAIVGLLYCAVLAVY